MSKATKIFLVVVVAICVAAFIIAGSFSSSMAKYDIGPTMYPRIVEVLTIMLAVVVFVGEIRHPNHAPVTIFSVKFFVHMALLLASVAVMPYLGFPVAAAIAMFPMMLIMGEKNYVKIGIIAVAAPLLLYAIFSLALGVPLPAGILEGIL